MWRWMCEIKRRLGEGGGEELVGVLSPINWYGDLKAREREEKIMILTSLLTPLFI